MRTRDEEVEDGRAVARLVEHPAVARALAGLRERYVQEMTDEPDTAALPRHQGKLRVLADVQQELQAIVDSGTRATIELQRQSAR